MRERGGGVIVNVSSTAGKRPSTGMPNYSVTKAAVLSLSRLVADLYAKDGIRCNAVTPGPTATEAWLGDGGLADQQASAAARRARRCSRRSAGRPLGRLAEPEEIAAVIAFLCSERAELRDRRGVERGRRHRPDHHLTASARCAQLRHTRQLARHVTESSIASTREGGGSTPPN